MIPTRFQYLPRIIKAWWYLRPLGGPVPTATQNMNAEVHMAVGRLHLRRAVATLKLFYHHSQLADCTGLMFHLDGTVNAGGKRYLQQHFPNAAFSDFPCTDPRVTDLLKKYEHLQKFYRQGSSVIFRLLPMRALARAPRIISLDSDLAFYARPQALVDWVHQEQNTLHHLIGNISDREQQAQEARQLLVNMMSDANGPVVQSENIDMRFNAGLMLLPTEMLDLSLVNRFCQWHVTHQGPRPGFWFHEWNIDQSAMMLVMAASGRAQPLTAPDYICGANEARVCNHYLYNTYYHTPVLQRMQKELRSFA